MAFYKPVAVNFDGTNDYLTRGAGLTGAADSKQVTGSFWIKFASDDATFRRILTSVTTVGGATTRTRMLRTANEQFQLIGVNAANTNILNLASATVGAIVAGNWYHILFSADLAVASGAHHVYVNDADDSNTGGLHTDDTLDFTLADWAIGANADGGTKADYDIADLMVWFGTYLDLTVTANRRMFITAAGKAVDPDATGGAIDTLGDPIIRQTNAVASWETNAGTGGGFTENGALGTSTTNPPSNADLVSAVGAFTLTGVAAALVQGFKLASAVGAFVLSGQTATLRWGRSIAGAVGEFILTGIDAGLKAALKIVSEVGTFVLTGIAAELKAALKIAGAVGAFTLTGVDAALRLGVTFVAEVGEFILTGIDATFRLGVSFAAAVGTFVLSGQAALFKIVISIAAAVGSFILATPVAVVLSYVQAAAAGLARFAKRRRMKPTLNDRRTSAPLLTRLRRNH